MAEQKLTHEAKEAIRFYMISLVTLPAFAATLVAFLLGYFIRDIAEKKAELSALERSHQVAAELKEVTTKVAEVKKQVSTLGDGVKKEQDKLNRLTDTITGAEKQLGKLLEDPEKVVNALKQLDAFDDEMKLAAQLNTIDSKVGTLTVDGQGIRVTEIKVNRLIVIDDEGREIGSLARSADFGAAQLVLKSPYDTPPQRVMQAGASISGEMGIVGRRDGTNLFELGVR